MNKNWKKKSHDEIKSIVFGALDKNVNYSKQNVLGIPATYLDDKIFSQDASFLKDAPFISTLVQNPNHIGCHTIGKSENIFTGTHAIEHEVLEICAVDILKSETQQYDGYVASGGTEANIQAMWIYRNYFVEKHNAKNDEICILCSEDSHYSMDKASNVLILDIYKVQVDSDNRTISKQSVSKAVTEAKKNGKKYFVVISNMMTTMFGSVDDVDCYANVLKELNCKFKMHIDGAFGGFYYPFVEDQSIIDFKNPNITSFTLDAHKMAQAPYGTGIFLIRKGFIDYAKTKQASYIEGDDCTLIGSRSGANAVAVWMILVKNGPFGWQEKIFILQKRTEWICKQLAKYNVEYYRHSGSNIVTIREQFITQKIADDYGLVPDNHNNPKWYKIVVMEHVTIEKLIPLINDIRKELGYEKITFSV